MIKQEAPKVGISAKDIFVVCAKGFRDSSKVARITKYESEVEKSANEYPSYIPFDIEHFPNHVISSKQEKDDIIDLYNLKFSKISFKAGRKYYDAIRNSSGGMCTICNVGVASTLDHFLPKSEFPLLCVCPDNLVPECDYCNKRKSDYFINSNSQTLLHPYFDDFSTTRWLDADLKFKKTILVSYYNSYTGDTNTKNRIGLTIEKYGLDGLFSIQANSEINNNTYGWKEVLNTSGRNALHDVINQKMKSCENYDLNSWSSALYRAIERRFDEFVEWLLISRSGCEK